MNITSPITASEWLALSEVQGRALFQALGPQARHRYRQWMHQWHPDRNPDPQAADVFIRLRQWFEAHQRKAALGHLEVEWTDDTGRRFRLRPQAQEPFVLGTYYRAAHRLVYRVLPEHRAWFDQAVHQLRTLPFANPAMEAQMRPLLPRLEAAMWGPEGGWLVLSRDPRAVRLLDWLHHPLRSALTGRHVAWVMSGLHHVACYLSYARIAHHGLTPENVWIVPETHEVHLLGGWWFAQPFGTPVTLLPADVVTHAPRRYREAKVAGPALDLALLPVLGRTLLGDSTGMTLVAGPEQPQALIDGLRRPAAASAQAQYERWQHTLTVAFGKRTFVPLESLSTTLYEEAHHG